jgi:hypothetical protein
VQPVVHKGLDVDILHLLDVVLERVRSEILCSLTFGEGELTSHEARSIDDLEEALQENMRPAIEAVGALLAVANSVGDPQAVIDHLLIGNGEHYLQYYFEDDQHEIRMADFFDSLQYAWRPMPPGQPYLIVYQPPDQIEEEEDASSEEPAT